MDTVIYRNVRDIANVEQEHLQSRTAAERAVDYIAYQAGRMWFIVAHMIWFGAWLVVNSGVLGKHLVFDAFPYSLLTTVVSLE